MLNVDRQKVTMLSAVIFIILSVAMTSVIMLNVAMLSFVVIKCHFLGNCDIHLNQKISVLNEMKQNNFVKTERKAPRKFLLNTTNFCSSSEQNLPNFHTFFMELIKFRNHYQNF
jgi:hypothetical protein